MARLLRYSCFLLLIGSLFVAEGCRQKGAEPKAHKRMWRKWSKKSDGFNPYVSKNTNKSTHEISRREKKEDDKAMKQAKKEYKKGIRRSARKRRGK